MKSPAEPTLGGWMVHVLREADSALSFEESLHSILDSMKVYFPAQSVAVVMVDDDTQEVRIKISRQISYSFAKQFRRKAPGPHIEGLMMRQQPLLVADAGQGSELYQEVKLEHDFTSAVLVPVIKDHRSVGYVICDRQAPPAFNESDQLHLQVIGFLIGSLMVKFELLQERRHFSQLDDATGALKYAAFVPALAVELKRAVTHAYPVTLALLHVPAFRFYLDTHGIDRAHGLLADLVKRAGRHLRETDLVARYSADRLVVCLSGATEADALSRLGDMQALANRELGTDSGIPVNILVGGVVLQSDAAKQKPMQDLMGLLGHALLDATAPEKGGINVGVVN
jgi:diguanylate cyclase (GGDEF)-like protein